jgi:hypothetical protein
VADSTTADQDGCAARHCRSVCAVADIIGEPEGLASVKEVSLKRQMSTPCWLRKSSSGPVEKMAATKVSFKDIQRDPTLPKLSKYENKCSDYFRLQSELKEARLELASLREIINILSRDSPSTGTRKHNLQEQEIPPTPVQPFEIWPSRHSTM